MLNHAARYFPILRELLPQLGSDETVLEIGAGSRGLGEFFGRSFVGCDVAFTGKPRKPMLPVVCSGDQLPFSDGSFDAVVSSDVLEHVPPPKRPHVVSEVLRVARRVAIFGFPCGSAAFDVDRELYLDYRRRGMTPPGWLQEHLLHPFPDGDLFGDLPAGWKAKVMPNESLNFHKWLMRAEMSRSSDLFFRLALLVVPSIIEHLLIRADREPSYRMIFVLRRSESVGV